MSLTPPLPAPPPGTKPRWLVALPARNEAARLGDALSALDAAAARSAGSVSVLVLANCCTDETATIARLSARGFRHLALEVREEALPPALAHAGGARAAAVLAARDAFGGGPGTLLLTTDADSRLRPDALVLAEGAFARGADLALAKIECAPDPFEPTSEAALAWGRPHVLWRHAVRQLVETVRTGTAPTPPLHDDYGAAGIAITLGAHDRLNGFAPVPSDEDLRLVRAADRAEMVVDRNCGFAVDVLTRTVGRAEGGMAAALRRAETAAARGETPLVEHHEATIERLLADPHHARAFATIVTRREPAETALTGIERAVALYGTSLMGSVPASTRRDTA